MSHLNPGLISAYNSLTDKHLAGYFSSTRIRRHLHRAGLITRSGRIVPDKEYRHKLIQRAHQRHVRECLAQAIFHKVLEMERVHQIEIKRKLEEFARRERVHKIKVERSKRYEEDIIRILSPHPPTGARTIQKQHSGPEGEHSESSESPGSSRPNTAPGKMQRPVRLKPIHSNSTTASLRRSSPYRLPESSNENDQPFNCTMDKESQRRLTTMEASLGISPYCLPVINNFVTPVPPATKRKERGAKVTPSGTLRGRRLRPTTASSGADVTEDPPVLRSSVHQSRVSVNMMYFGKTVHLSHDLIDMRDEVKVFQQHCGGENLCVYKGLLREGETFQFISRRHRGFPFSLTFFLNGLQVERLSSCCEFKHRKGSRLGGRHRHFGFSSVEGASPCYKCIIAMGLDKKPTPPPKRVKDDGGREEPVISPKDASEMETERTQEDTSSHSECETSQPQDMETQVKEETAAEEDKVRDDYEEDFEADDEGSAEDAKAKEKKSPSPSGETERQFKKKDASETEDDEKDDIKSHSGFSSSGSDREESDAEATKDSREDEKEEQPKEVDQAETAVPTDEKDEPNPEEAAATESAVPKDSDIQNSAGDSTEIDISDTGVPSGNVNKQSDDTSGDKEVEKTVDESKQEEEQERAKSVQERLAEAILKESQCSSEPELHDASSEEEEEESTDKGPEQDNKDAVLEKSVTFTEQQQTLVEETKCEEGVVGEVEVVQDQEEMSEPKEQGDETEEPHENSDSTKDEKIDEEDEKAASIEDKNTAENDKSEDTEDTGLHPVSEEEMAEDDKTSEPQEDAAAKSTDAKAAVRDEENKEKTAVEADTQPDKMGQGAKSSEEDESSVSEPNKKTGETAVPDNAEAEAMTASETMEMKVEPSEKREAFKCEEAPVTDTEKRQNGDSEDRAAASQTAENSSSSLEGSGDTTVDTSEDNAKNKCNKDDIKEEEAEEVSAVEASKDDNQQEMCDMGEEQTEKSVEIDDKLEEKSEEVGKEVGKQTNPDDITEGDNNEERERDAKYKTGEEENNENKTEERIENEENISEWTKSDSNSEGKENEEQVEKTHSEEDKVANEEKEDESEKTEKDKDSERVKNENDEEESEENGATSDKTNEGEKINETNTAADEEKDVEAEKEEKDQNENKAEQSEAAKNKDDEESEEKKVVTVEGEEISEITEEPEKNADADLDKDNVKISDENIDESEDVSDSEAANVAHGTKTTEEMLNNAMEAEDVKKETERQSDNSEKGEIDAENGEFSTGAENRTHEDKGEAQTEGKNDVKIAEDTEDKRKTEEPTEDESTEGKEVTVDSGDGAEKHEEDKVDQAPDTHVVESEAKEGDDSVEKQDESTKTDSEPETSDVEIKSKSDDRKVGEETKQDENGNMSDPDHENSDSDLTKKNDNVQSNVNAVIAASSGDQAQSSTPIVVDLESIGHKLDESTAPSDSKTDEHPHTDATAADLSAADEENEADTEEVSKASEEGASVLLKPQAQSSQLTQNSEADNTEGTIAAIAVGKETPEALAREDNTDLVTNWVTTHQTSKFFETFVEPLEDLKELPSAAQVTNSSKEATQSIELPGSASPLNMVNMCESAEQEQTPKDGNESRDKTKEEAVESDLESNHSDDDEPCENDSAKDTLQVEEETEVKDFRPKTESEQNDIESVNEQDVRSEEHRGSRGSLEEDTVQEGLMQDNTEQTDVSKTEVESIAGTHHSVTSGRPESICESQTEEKTTDNGPDLNEKQAAIEEMKVVLPSSKTEEHREHSASPEGLSELKANELKDKEETREQSQEVTEITDFTASKSEDGSQEEFQPKPSDASINEDRRDVQLIKDITHTLSKDRLSTFSVDETLFGRSSYPLLTTTRTESGH
ncbi:glutamate-rich protein 3 isoform X2 [Siniperca chuatsi]|uniref:glutamate-rich protein 3 isoform X2 n=1 Tax=Siniperca chuatsi TaxID=119488 RepID=UPI001CE15643|nr:glutamate-rich protein 3 isoform X2 [Siniperca chuatsi]